MKQAYMFSPRLEADINYLMGVEPEEGETSTTIFEAIKDLMQSSDEPEHYSYEHRRELREFGIKVGIFKPMTQRDLDNTYVTRGSKYDFKKAGIPYRFDSWKPIS